MDNALLGGMTAAQFLRRHWQKKPLLVRGAIAGFEGPVTADALFALAARDDVESRIVLHERGRWSLRHGPIRRADRRTLPRRNWTLLVQGVNLHVPDADALLRRFAFIPYARLDDLMVSLAAPGGGVGPHVDSYDVFLLQGTGRRRWRTSRQPDQALKPGLPLKILARFRPQQSRVLAPGDMLYLPPRVAHEGTAVESCITYSIGFRAPETQELVLAFLDWLRDRVELPGGYDDRDLAATREPARIGSTMRARARAMLRRLRWDDQTAEQFLGCYLTDPKPTVRFATPAHPLEARVFRRAVRGRGVVLDACTQLLYDEQHLFINGEAMAWPSRGPGTAAALKRLANRRCLTAAEVRGAAPLRLLYQWYGHGFLRLG